MTLDELSDNRLMALIVDRDEHALAALFERHAPKVLALAIRILGEIVSAEDIVQETFLRVWTRAHTFDSEKGKVSSWVWGIAHNLSIDFVRKHGTKDRAVRLVGNPIPVPDTDEAAFDSLRRGQVRAAIAELPESQREVIEMSYFKGLTRREIAKMTGEPLGTVNTRARLGLQKLRAALDEVGFEAQ